MKARRWRAFLFYSCFSSLVVIWDFGLRVRYAIRPRWARGWAERKAHGMARLVLTVTRRYMDHRIDFTSSVAINQIPPRFLLVANHQSIVDIPVLMSTFPDHSFRFTAKRSLFRAVPLISLMLRVQRHAAVHREGGAHETFASLRRLGASRNERVCPVIFPEGTRSRSGQLGSFHPGAVSLIARTSGLPILCVSIDGGHTVSDVTSLGMHLQGCRYRVHVEKLYPPRGTRTYLMRVVRESEQLVSRRLDIWNRAPE